jgi:hypothetical protein
VNVSTTFSHVVLFISGIMDVMAVLTGSDDDMEVHIQPILHFLAVYQTCEDNMIELKLARQLPVASKMTMGVEFAYMKVGIYDERCPGIIMMALHAIKAELKTFKLTVDNLRCYQNKLCTDTNNTSTQAPQETPPQPLPASRRLSISRQNTPQPVAVLMSVNVEKVMKASFKKVEFLLCKPLRKIYDDSPYETVAIVEEGDFCKTLRVFNENSFVDDDHMVINVKRVEFTHINSPFMDWLLALQDASNVMPVSRFAHLKESEIKINAENMLFSTAPAAFDCDVVNYNKTAFAAMAAQSDSTR